MTEEEKKAMEWLDILKDCCDYKDIEYSITKNGYESLGKAINTIINLIEKQQKELEKKDKIIDKMAGNVFLMNGDRGCTKQEKIDYFTNLVEKENK